MLNYKKVFNELWKKAGYKEKQNLIFTDSKEVCRLQEGLYSYAGIKFTYNMPGYENFTIIE